MLAEYKLTRADLIDLHTSGDVMVVMTGPHTDQVDVTYNPNSGTYEFEYRGEEYGPYKCLEALAEGVATVARIKLILPPLKLSEKYRALGFKWDCEEEYMPDGEGFRWAKSLFGERPMYEGVLVASSTFCLYWCNVVAKYPLTEETFDRFPGTELWVFEIPEDIYKATKPHLPKLTRYLCLPVNKDHAYVAWNWNPVLIDTPKAARRYLTGWTN